MYYFHLEIWLECVNNFLNIRKYKFGNKSCYIIYLIIFNQISYSNETVKQNNFSKGQIKWKLVTNWHIGIGVHMFVGSIVVLK